MGNKMKGYRWDKEEETDISLTLTEAVCHLKQQQQPHLTLGECEYISAFSSPKNFCHCFVCVDFPVPLGAENK